MKLIVTDFDGTFYDDNYLENIKFIESIKDKYDFVIATGRNYKFLKEDLKIACKYYICNDGGYILDSNENLMYSNFIERKTVGIIYDRIKKLGYEDYFFDYISENGIEISDNINKIAIKIHNNNALNDMNYILNGLNDVYGYLSENWININNKASKKELAIAKLLDINKYDKVYVIGNEINDFGMLKKYSGFLISNEKKEGYNTIKNFLEFKKELL